MKQFYMILILFFIYNCGEDVFNETEIFQDNPPEIKFYEYFGNIKVKNEMIIEEEATVGVIIKDDYGVSGVQFYLDGTLIFEKFKPPYEFLFNPKIYDEGMHILEAVAYDTGNNTNDASLIITTLNPPSIKIIYPENNDTVCGKDYVLVEITKKEEFESIKLYLNSKELGEIISEFKEIDFSQYEKGKYNLFAKGELKDGKIQQDLVTININKECEKKCFVYFENIQSESYISGEKEINILASSSIKEVVLNIDDVFYKKITATPFYLKVNSKDFTDGKHKLEVVGKIDENKKCSKSVEIIIDNTLPSLKIFSPVDFTVIDGKYEIILEYDDNIGVEKVRLNLESKEEKIYLEEIKPPEKKKLINFFKFKAGVYTLRAFAFDKAGNEKEEKVNYLINLSQDIKIQNISLCVVKKDGEVCSKPEEISYIKDKSFFLDVSLYRPPDYNALYEILKEDFTLVNILKILDEKILPQISLFYGEIYIDDELKKSDNNIFPSLTFSYKGYTDFFPDGYHEVLIKALQGNAIPFEKKFKFLINKTGKEIKICEKWGEGKVFLKMETTPSKDFTIDEKGNIHFVKRDEKLYYYKFDESGEELEKKLLDDSKPIVIDPKLKGDIMGVGISSSNGKIYIGYISNCDEKYCVNFIEKNDDEIKFEILDKFEKSGYVPSTLDIKVSSSGGKILIYYFYYYKNILLIKENGEWQKIENIPEFQEVKKILIDKNFFIHLVGELWNTSGYTSSINNFKIFPFPFYNYEDFYVDEFERVKIVFIPSDLSLAKLILLNLEPFNFEYNITDLTKLIDPEKNGNLILPQEASIFIDDLNVIYLIYLAEIISKCKICPIQEKEVYLNLLLNSYKEDWKKELFFDLSTIFEGSEITKSLSKIIVDCNKNIYYMFSTNMISYITYILKLPCEGFIPSAIY